MALSRIRCTVNFTTLCAKSSYIATCSRHQPGVKQLHGSVARLYLETPKLGLPTNLSETYNGQMSRFKSERARDIGASYVVHGPGARAPVEPLQPHSHPDSFGYFGAINLSGSMQTNVPKAHLASGHPTYLTMPGSQWARMGGYLAEDRLRSHYNVYRAKATSDILNGQVKSARCYSTTTTTTTTNTEDCQIKEKKNAITLSKKDRLRITAVQFGTGILIIHLVVTLVSLTILYTLISSGVDLRPFINHLYKLPEEKLDSIFDQNSEFWLAYKINKLIFPLRITFTLFSTYVVVRYLRMKKIAKTPKYILRTLENRSSAK